MHSLLEPYICRCIVMRLPIICEVSVKFWNCNHSLNHMGWTMVHILSYSSNCPVGDVKMSENMIMQGLVWD
jgi:hypothetical protein